MAAPTLPPTIPASFGTGTITFNRGGIGTLPDTPATGLTISNNYNFGADPSGYFENYHPFIKSGNGNLGSGAALNVYTTQVTLSGVVSGGSLMLAAGSHVLELNNANNMFTGPSATGNGLADGISRFKKIHAAPARWARPFPISDTAAAARSSTAARFNSRTIRWPAAETARISPPIARSPRRTTTSRRSRSAS